MQYIPGNFNAKNTAILHIDAATASAKKYSIPASVTIAQACLETGFGEHIPPNSNNCFGIKAKGNEPSVNVKTHEYVGTSQREPIEVYARFKKFQSIEDYFEPTSIFASF
jgi:flagellum-specific peptidoglycan hydrolase FlgJ